MPKNKKTKKVVTERKEKLTKRTIQIIGFGASTILFIIKLVVFLMGIEGDIIPWWVIMGFVGIGVSGSYDVSLPGGKR